MSKKFLNRVVSAILMIAVASTMFLGGVVNAETTATATYTIHDYAVVTSGSTQSSAYVTFESETPFSLVRFQVSATSPLTLSSAEFVEGTMADDTSATESLVSYELATEDDPAAVMAEIINEEDIKNRNYYKSITIKLNFSGGVNPWVQYLVTLGETDMSAMGESTIFTVTEATLEDAINYIHAHTYGAMPTNRTDATDTYYSIGTFKCRYCGDEIKQLAPDNVANDPSTTERGIISSLVVHAMSVSFNDDGTMNIHAYVNSPYYHLQLVVCPTDGYKYHQFGGNANDEGQGKEDISVLDGEQVGIGEYIFTFTGIPAKDIGEKLLFTVFAEGAKTGGKLYYGPSKTYSLADYCYDVIEGGENVVGKEDGDDELYASLLDYGAAAQVYAGETNEDNLANAKLAEKDAYKTAMDDAEMEEITANNSEGFTNENCKVYGTSLILRANASLKFYFALNGDYRDNENVVITLMRGSTELKSLTASQLQHADSSGRYYAYTLDVPPKQLEDVITVDISVGENESYSGTYSVAGYARAAYYNDNASEALKNVSKALVYYGRMLEARYPSTVA